MQQHWWILHAYCYMKGASLKDFILYDFIYMTFQKMQNDRNREKISGYQRSVEGKCWLGEAQGFLGQWNSFVWYYGGRFVPPCICQYL